MIGGDEQALFENCFGQQGQQLILHEEVVYVPRHALGGTGPALHCGFPADSDEPDLTRPCPYEEEDLPDPEGSDWVKELMIYGTGRSNWGSFRFRGRVRAFDGLLTLLKEYAVSPFVFIPWSGRRPARAGGPSRAAPLLDADARP